MFNVLLGYNMYAPCDLIEFKITSIFCISYCNLYPRLRYWSYDGVHGMVLTQSKT